MTKKKWILFYSIGYLFIGLLPMGCSNPPQKVSIYASSQAPKMDFALEEIKSSLTKKGLTFEMSKNEDADISITLSPSRSLKKEGFSIERQNNKIKVTGADPAGAMYGGLELAEQIQLYGLDSIREITKNPYMEMRGAKFNIPLDMRTPSYTDASDAGQKNIPVMWDFKFWKEFIDNIAKYRYNYVSLWNLHPFPSLVKVPDYPDIALDNVERSTTKWKANYNLNGIGLDAPEIVKDPEIVKKMTMDEKIAFWKKVMKYGKDRNVNFYFITWNIFTNGTDGKYGITDDIHNKTTQDYFKKSVKQMFVTYPDLAGIGLTTGENMKGANAEEREDWAYETYAQGILEAAREMSDRKFTFIHRQHQTEAKEIAEKFKSVIDAKNVDFLYCFKYAKAHLYSATTQPYHEKFAEEIDRGGMKTIWGLRNDDTYYFRWGAPDFVREFIQNMPHKVAKGIYFGSDQWIWGREFLTKEPDSQPRELEIKKHWYQWMLWGRLAYDPNITDERFTQILHSRYPEADASKLFQAWQNASMIYPTTTGFHWGALDFQWYIEACKSRPGPAENNTGFHDVNRFITLPPHPKSGFQSIPNFVKMTIKGGTSKLKSPLDVSQMLKEFSNAALNGIKSIDSQTDTELNYTLNDIRTVAYMGLYYSAKISGATYLALYRETKDPKYQQAALLNLTNALEHWKKYVSQAIVQNTNPLWTNRVGIVDWEEITVWVAQEVEIAKEK